MKHRICVVGAGVVGLSSALKIKETLRSACDVVIVADKFGQDTTSDIAGGSFRPTDVPSVSGYLGNRSAIGKDIILLSYERYKSILTSTESDAAGVHILSGYDIKHPGVGTNKEPFYTEFFTKWHTVSESSLAEKFPRLPLGSSGKFLETMIVSPRTYMPFLTQKFKDLGGTMTRRFINSFDELWDEFDIVVNCTGLGAACLTGDHTVVPNRGQVIRMNLTRGKNTFVYINNGAERMPYYIWTPDYTVIGGTKMVGNHDARLSQDDHDMIMRECKAAFPWLDISEDKIVREVVGFRPSRPSIRLEVEPVHCKGNKKLIVHNYGHCAHGVSLSWGSACIVVEMILSAIHGSKL